MKKTMFSIVLFMILSLLSLAYADTINWSGPNGGLYNDPCNWTPQGIPTESDLIGIINNNECVLTHGDFRTVHDVNIGQGSYVSRFSVLGILRVINDIMLGLGASGSGDLTIGRVVGTNVESGIVYTQNLNWGLYMGKVYINAGSKLHISGSLGLDANSSILQGIALASSAELIWDGQHYDILRTLRQNGNITLFTGPDPNRINVFYVEDLDETHVTGIVILSSSDINKDNKVNFSDLALFANHWLEEF